MNPTPITTTQDNAYVDQQLVLLDALCELFIGVPLAEIKEEQRTEAIEELLSTIRKKMYGYVSQNYDKKTAYQFMRNLEERKDMDTNPETMTLLKKAFDNIVETA